MAVRCFYPIFTANKKQELMNTGKWLLCLCLFTLIINSAAATDKCAGNDQRAFPMITIPDTIQEIDRRALYLAEHYWNLFDFTADSSQIIHPQTEQAFVNYLDILKMEPIKKHASDIIPKMMQGIEKYPETWHIFYDWYDMYLFDDASPVKDEELYLDFLDYVLKSHMLPEEELIRPQYLYGLLNKNKVGTVASDFEYQMENGENLRLKDLQGEYTLLFFYDPECEHCQESIKEINRSSLYEFISNDEIQVLAVNINGDFPDWEKQRSLLPGKWLNAIDKSLTIRDEELYYIPFLPALYLLDSKKIVIFRNCSLQELEFYFKNRDR